MLQPVVEKKGCEKVLGEMRDCLVETNCWGKCDEEVERFQQCINTRYFQEDVQESSDENAETEVDKNESNEVEETTMKDDSNGELPNEEILKNEELIVEIKEEENDKEEDSNSKMKDEEGHSAVDKDSFCVKIIAKAEDDVKDENLLFKISVKDIKPET